jgi:hypothetical protein
LPKGAETGVKNQCGNRVCKNVKNMGLFKGGSSPLGLKKISGKELFVALCRFVQLT